MGSLKPGSGLSGAGIGSFTSQTFATCRAIDGAFTLTAGHLPWHLNAVSFKSATGVTTGTITGVHVLLSNSTIPCSAIIDGTSATADNGKVKVTYRNSTGKLTMLTAGGNLVFYDSTCAGIHNGDHATLSASYLVAPSKPSPARNPAADRNHQSRGSRGSRTPGLMPRTTAPLAEGQHAWLTVSARSAGTQLLA